MPRAHRYFLPGQVWHLTHRCHQRMFLLKFARDRRRYVHWLFEARKRFGLCVLNYIVTSNHILRREAFARIIQAFAEEGIKFAEHRVTVNVPPGTPLDVAAATAVTGAGARKP